MPTHERYRFWGNPACWPNSWLRCRSCVRLADRCVRDGARLCLRTCLRFPVRVIRPAQRPVGVPARRCALPHGDGPPYAGYPQRDRAPHDVGDVPDSLQPSHALAIGQVTLLEVSARPEREPHQTRRSGTSEVVVLRRKLERPPGMPYRLENIAPNQGLCGPVQLDRARHAPKLLLIDDDHIRSGFRFVASVLSSFARSAQRPAAGPQRPRTHRSRLAHRQSQH